MTAPVAPSSAATPLVRPPATPSLKSLGRRAGLLFLLYGLPAPFALLYVPSMIFVPGNVTATAERVREHAILVRLAIVAEVWQCVVLVFAALALYRLLRQLDRYLAVVTAALMGISLPIQLLNLVNHLAPLALTSGTAFPAAFPREQLDGLVYLFLRIHAAGLQIAQVLWGLWLIPWGLVAVRTAFMPRWIGGAIIVAGAAYMVNSAVAILAPALSPVVAPYLLALGVSELAKTGYLVVWGAREPAPAAIRSGNF